MRVIFLLAGVSLLVGCNQVEPSAQAARPMQAVPPAATLAPVAASEKSVAARSAAPAPAKQEDRRRAVRLGDPARTLERESARMAAHAVPGVRSVVWIDNDNLLVIVDRNEARSPATIDAICQGLEPIGDTLGVVVNLQSGAATNGDELEILGRPCQPLPDDAASSKSRRLVDAISPEMRAQHRATSSAANAAAANREAEAAESLRVLEASTPEMRHLERQPL